MPPLTRPVDSAALGRLHRELGIPSDYAASRSLVLQSEAVEADLVTVPHAAPNHVVRLLPDVTAGWIALHAAAARESIALEAYSGFRSVARQAEIVQAKLNSGMTIQEILRTVAPPGFSEHHTGRAIDLGTPGEPELEESFGQTPAFAWLSRCAADFGFTLSYPRNNRHGIAFEPWHWFFRH